MKRTGARGARKRFPAWSGARLPALAYCQGTPLRSDIESRAAARLDEATDAAEKAIVQRFGEGVVDGKMQAYIVTIKR